MGARETLSAFWSVRSARERAVLAAGAILCATAALYAGLWDPGLEARKRLSTALPKLRAQLEDMRLQKKEIEQLRGTLAPATGAADLQALLRGSVERGALQRSVDRVEWRSSDRVLVAASSVDFDQWLDWVRGLQRDFGVRLETCEVKALAQPGMVRVEAVFAAAGKGP
jgi:type II secretory pathway component PulM